MAQSRAEKAYTISEIVYTVSYTLTSTVATVFLLSKPGMTYSKAGILFSIYLLALGICDFPTGNLADLYGRKKIYSVGLVLLSLQQLLYAVSNSFGIFALGAVLGGLGTAQMSGALVSWLYDQLKKDEKTENFSVTLGKTRTATSLASMIIALLLGTLYRGPMNLLFLGSFVIYVGLAIGMFVLLPENYGARKRGIRISLDTLSYFFKKPLLIRVGFFLIIIYGCYSVLCFYWQPIALKQGILSGNLGYIYFFYLAASALSGIIIAKIGKKFSDNTLFIASFVTLGLSFLSVYLFTNVIMLCLSLILFGLGYGSFMPIYSRHVHGMIPSEIRSSVASLLSTLGSIAAVIFNVLIGGLIDKYDVKVSLLVGVIMILSTLLIYLIFAFTANQKEKITA